MPSPSLVSVLRHVRRTAADAAGANDAALLERFAADRDEAAFELLVWRHGPMVFGICRRQLRDAHAAEDAFQATFLALARRAKSIRRQASVAGWLYRVAGRMALAARERVTRKNEQPLNGIIPPGRDSEPVNELSLRELRQTLDDAIARLPARYRDPLVLTCFTGRSHAAAARELGCAVRTIESRLGRARQKLRAVLLRRGFLPAGGLAAALAPADAPAGVATSLVIATVKAAGRGAASISVETLTQGVLHAMLLSNIKIAGAVVFVAGFVGLGTGGWVYQSRAVGQTAAGQPPTIKPEPVAAQPVIPIQQARKQRVQNLLRELTEALNNDPSGDAMQNLEAILKTARDRQEQARRDKELHSALVSLANNIAALKKAASGNRAWENPVSEFDRAFGVLSTRLGVTIAAGSDSDDPNIPTYTWTYLGFENVNSGGATKPANVGSSNGSRSEFFKVTKVSNDLIVIAGGRSAGVADGQQLLIYRTTSTPTLVGKVTILTVTPMESVGRVTFKVTGMETQVGDQVYSKDRSRERGR